jgi:hypothetical protein
MARRPSFFLPLRRGLDCKYFMLSTKKRGWGGVAITPFAGKRLDLRFQALAWEIATRHLTHGGEFGAWRASGKARLTRLAGRLLARKPARLVTVALANKLARIISAVMTTGTFWAWSQAAWQVVCQAVLEGDGLVFQLVLQLARRPAARAEETVRPRVA